MGELHPNLTDEEEAEIKRKGAELFEDYKHGKIGLEEAEFMLRNFINSEIPGSRTFEALEAANIAHNYFRPRIESAEETGRLSVHPEKSTIPSPNTSAKRMESGEKEFTEDTISKGRTPDMAGILSPKEAAEIDRAASELFELHYKQGESSFNINLVYRDLTRWIERGIVPMIQRRGGHVPSRKELHSIATEVINEIAESEYNLDANQLRKTRSGQEIERPRPVSEPGPTQENVRTQGEEIHERFSTIMADYLTKGDDAKIRGYYRDMGMDDDLTMSESLSYYKEAYAAARKAYSEGGEEAAHRELKANYPGVVRDPVIKACKDAADQERQSSKQPGPPYGSPLQPGPPEREPSPKPPEEKKPAISGRPQPSGNAPGYGGGHAEGGGYGSGGGGGWGGMGWGPKGSGENPKGKRDFFEAYKDLKNKMETDKIETKFLPKGAAEAVYVSREEAGAIVHYLDKLWERTFGK